MGLVMEAEQQPARQQYGVTPLPACYKLLPADPGATGFVFICPGYHEQVAGRPCAHTAGVRLSELLAELAGDNLRIFHSANRYDYFITNAWPYVEHVRHDQDGYTGRTIPTEGEVLVPGNLERLHHEIQHLTHIVACGRVAHLAVQECIARFDLDATVAYVDHTTRLGLRRNDPKPLDVRKADWIRSVRAAFWIVAR